MYSLLKSLYGLRQSKRLWNQNVISFYKQIDFTKLNRDLSILIHCKDNKVSIVSVYVDDFFLVSNTMTNLNTLKQSLVEEYDTKDLGDINTIIGWEINRDNTVGTMKIY